MKRKLLTPSSPRRQRGEGKRLREERVEDRGKISIGVQQIQQEK
jgi:hypothetical protein